MSNNIYIDTSKNLYTYNYVNCFEKPLGLILNNYGEEFQSFFYIFLKMFQSYNITNFEDESIFYTIGFNNALKYILEEKLDFEIKIVKEEPGRINSVIKKRIDEGHPALVPGNLRELSYTEYYKTSDWKHLFLINGYNEEKEIYSVIDSDHKKNDHFLEYKEVYTSYGLMERLYTSAKEKFDIAYIWSIYKKDGVKQPVEMNLLKDVFNMFLNHRTEQPYKELEYIKRINRELDEKAVEKEIAEDSDPTTQIDFIFLRAVKYKDTFYNELIKIMKKLSVRSDLIEKLEVQKINTNKKWSDITNASLVQHYLKEKVQLSSEIAHVIKLEEEIITIVDLLLKEL